jgi:hypothetical protein
VTIIPQSDDSNDFVKQVELVVHGVLYRYTPETLVLIKIDNWFGSSWLGFSGKVLGALGVWHKSYNQPADNIRIPPFVPNRVVSQRRFAAPAYEEVDAGKRLHIHIASTDALARKARTLLPNTALMWYSGNSSATGRGAVMVYAPVGASYWPWYVSLEKGMPWRVTETWDIKRQDFSRIIEQGAGIIGP